MKVTCFLLTLVILIQPVSAENKSTGLEKLRERDRKEQTLAVYQNKTLMFSADYKGRKAELVSLETGKNVWDENENDLSRALQAVNTKNLLGIGYDYTYHDQYFFLYQFVRNKPSKLICFNFITGEKKCELSEKYYWNLPLGIYDDKAFLVAREDYKKETEPVFVVINYITGNISIERTWDLPDYKGFVLASGDHMLLASGNVYYLV